MLKPKIKILLLVGCLIFTGIPTALCGTSASTIYVAGDGSGNYNCDGTDDHIQINQALKFVAENPGYTTVHLKGPFTYSIDNTLLIGSNTILEGDSNAKIRLVDNAGWPQNQGLVEPLGGEANSIIIQGFEIDGNDEAQPVSNGALYYTIFLLDGCSNVTVRNMYLHNCNNDGIRVLNSAYSENEGNINVYNNKFYYCCHDSVYLTKVSNANIYNNTFTPRTNDAITITDSNHISIHDNIIDPGTPTGGCGIQIQKTSSTPNMDDIEIYKNKINNTNLAGILIHGYNSYPVPSGARDVYVHHNIIVGCGQHMGLSSYWGGGISVEGFHNTVIENNVIDSCYHDGIAMKNIWSAPPSYTYNTIIRNNVITNTNAGRLNSGSGYGINSYSSSYTATLEYNDVWSNEAGNYNGVTAGTTDIHVDPLFASSSDYHLKSVAGRWSNSGWVLDSKTSPLIDAGSPKSNYSAEPKPNGSRINIGRYGNTAEASKSVSNQPTASAGSDQTVTAGQTVNLNGLGSTDDIGITSYSWDFDASNGIQKDASGSLVQHTYNNTGTYTVTLNVMDNNGNTDSDTATITVTSPSNLPVTGESVSQETGLLSNRLRESSPSEVFRDKTFIDIGGMNDVTKDGSDVGRYRDVMSFNLSGYTSATQVSKATISLFWFYPSNSRPNDTIIEIYRPASSWNASYVSWNMKNKGVSWNNPGGDWYDKNGVLQGTTPYATLTLKANALPSNTYCELNVTDLVKEYVSGKYENTGFLIKARNENNDYVAFYSSKCGNTNQVPKLNITKTTVSSQVSNIILTEAKDNLIRQSSPETLFSNKVFLDVGGVGSSKYRDLILFNISGYTSVTKANSATLSLWWYYPNSSRLNDTVIEIYRPAFSWNPSYVSWNKRNKGIAWNNPGGDWYDKKGILQGNTPYATLTLKATALPTNKYCVLNVTDLVNEYLSGKYENTGFLIKARNENNNYIAFYSADCGNASRYPKLTIK